MDSYFYFVTENKNKLYGGATTNYKKKIKVRGLHIFT
jgi:predicted GIY-YIG superfamily endonuclease